MPSSDAGSRAAAIASPEKSAPVTVAPEPRPRQRVHAEVALQVQQRLPGDVAYLVTLNRHQRVATGLERGDVVELGGDVDGRHSIPEFAVVVDVLLHGAIIRIQARPSFDRRIRAKDQGEGSGFRLR